MRSAVTIYALRDPRTNAVVYIGQTYRNLQTRLMEHKRNKKQRRIYTWIDELKEEDLEPIIEPLEEVYPLNARIKEAKWVKHFEEQGAELLNTNRRYHRGI